MKTTRMMIAAVLMVVLSTGFAFAGPIPLGTVFTFEQTRTGGALGANGTGTVSYTFDIKDPDVTGGLAGGQALADTAGSLIKITDLNLVLTGVVDATGLSGFWGLSVTPVGPLATVLERIALPGSTPPAIISIPLGDLTGAGGVGAVNATAATTGPSAVTWTYTSTGRGAVSFTGAAAHLLLPSAVSAVVVGIGSSTLTLTSAKLTGTATVVPEPGTLILLGGGLLSLIGMQFGLQRRKRKGSVV